MSSSLFGPSTNPTSYSSDRLPVHGSNHISNVPTHVGTTSAVTAGGAVTLGIIAKCNYYATIIGYITVLIVGYLIVSWIMSFFGSSSSAKKKDCDDSNEEFDDIDEDEEHPKRRRKKQVI
jgi:hypothetical protein